MKIHIIAYSLLAGLLWSAGLYGQARLYIGGGSTLLAQGAARIVLHDCALENEGELQLGEGAVAFLGSQAGAAYLSGNGFSALGELRIARPGEELRLMSDVEISRNLYLQTGKLNLNGQEVHFTEPDAVFTGESSTDHAYGDGALIAGKPLLGPIMESVGGLDALVSAQGDLGYTEVRRGHERQLTPGGRSIARWYDIYTDEPLDARLRLHYFDHELGGMDADGLVVWNSLDGGLNWSAIPYSVHDTHDNWIEIAGHRLGGRYTFAYPAMASTTLSVAPQRPATGLQDLQLFPNPASTEVALQLHSEADGQLPIFWFSADGRLVRQSVEPLRKGSNQFNFELSGLPAGVYWIRLGSYEGTAVRLIKQ